MNRRDFVRAGCACGALLASAHALAQGWAAPARFVRPDVSTDEGGFWSLMDREETRLRRSPFLLRDPGLREYVQGVACRVSADHCPDVRVHIVRAPFFNANMAPNGMMQVWTGLLLRIENEAQLAAILAHEVAHYLERHTIEQLRDAKARSAFAQFLGAFGLVGAVGQIAVLASAMAYSRDQERAADRIGLTLMRNAGYDPAEAAKIWGNLFLESQAADSDSARDNVLFSTHPGVEERREALAALARDAPGGVTHTEVWREKIKPHLREWLFAEIQRGRHEQSLALLSRMLEGAPSQPELAFARGEIYRLRAKPQDYDAALADYRRAASIGGEPPETHRGLGFIYRVRNQLPEAKESFERYLKLAPDAADALMIKSYMEELPT
jgi:predicted Zn-dependent protease